MSDETPKYYPWTDNADIFTAAVVLAVAILLLAERNREGSPEKAAEAMLTRTYSATQQDCENLNSAILRSRGDDQILLDYLHTVYGGRLTENGFKACAANRVPSRAANLAKEEKSDLKVSSIALEPADAEEGSRRYIFTVRAQTTKGASKTFTFRGSIRLLREEGRWKVDGIA